MTTTRKTASARSIIRQFGEQEYAGELCAVTSFGAESAVLLHLIASVDPSLPVRFIDTGRHFPETLAYRDLLVARLGLTNLLSLHPLPEAVGRADGAGQLHLLDPDLCCRIRKTDPFAELSRRFRAVLTGRKRHHGDDRAALQLVEVVDGLVRIHPLADWTVGDMNRYRLLNDLPPHPLVARGYSSIGCAPCTTRTVQGESARAGRWRGVTKTECGIHLPPVSTGK
ncbi:MAG: phosphoadenylyl-sulfate reductase [Rhodospirillales bacterium]